MSGVKPGYEGTAEDSRIPRTSRGQTQVGGNTREGDIVEITRGRFKLGTRFKLKRYVTSSTAGEIWDAVRIGGHYLEYVQSCDFRVIKPASRKLQRAARDRSKGEAA